MNFLYRLLLYLSELELARAKKSPVRNAKHVAACSADVARWELALFQWQHKPRR